MSAIAPSISRDRIDHFLAALADPARGPVPASEVAIVVAHPDDETIACGAQLRRLSGATLVVVTDGAPRKVDEALRHGFSGVEDYAAARAHELDAALALASVSGGNVVRLGMFDQAAALRLAELTRTLYSLIEARGLDLLMTHAFEGGHPDHDATAFAVHIAAAIERRRGRSVAVVEMPFYRAGHEGPAIQCFSPGQHATYVIRLTAEEQALKRSMLEAYATQRDILAAFDVAQESFRRAPAYDFTALPNEGRLLYESHDWGMTGKRWIALARAALSELGEAT
jgi:N-acetylglucosamine malate deacetylase 2